MNLEDSYFISQIVASVAVVASILYLALQTRQAARYSMASIEEMRLSRACDIAIRNVEGDMAIASLKCGLGDASTTDIEVTQFFVTSTVTLLSIQDAFVQHRRGMIDDSALELSKSQLHFLMTVPGQRVFWALSRARYGAEFATMVDRICDEARHLPISLPDAKMWTSLVARELATQPNAQALR